MHVTQVHPVTTEIQFHCTRLYTVRSDVEERVAEERLAWNDKNIPAWPKNISVL